MAGSQSPFPPQSWSGIDDVVIIGGGLAGLFCALKLAPRPVTIVTGAAIGEGASSAWAQGGIAAAIGPGDTVEAHVADTLSVGGDIVDERIATTMVNDAADRIHDLLEFGVPFDRDLEGALTLSREAAHSQRRIVHVRGDMAGAAIMDALVSSVRRTPSIRVLEGVVAEQLRTEGSYVTGLVVRDLRGGLSDRLLIATRAIVLASGGIGYLYDVTTNPPEARGEGLAMAAAAGAQIADPEFVQFHPTAVDLGLDPAPLATEALRGEGATLIDKAGERFMFEVHPDGELAPRDIVARAVHEARQSGRGALLDCRTAIGAEFPDMFPTVFAACMSAGLDPVTTPIPVAPAAHYHMGGVHVDGLGRTSLDGLWACGEVASTGAHGANRLASNSLLEAVVFAARIADDVQGLLPNHKLIGWSGEGTVDAPDQVESEADIMRQLRTTMGRNVGVIRNGAGLSSTLLEIEGLLGRAFQPQIRNALTAAKIITTAALARKESRGGHYRSDYADPNPDLAKRTFTSLKDVDTAVADLMRSDGEPALEETAS